MYQVEYHPHEVSNTEKQQAVKSVFKDKAKVAAAWWNKNKPPQQNPTGTEAYRAVKKAYGAQIKIGNPYSFLRSLVTEDLKVVLAGKDITDGVTAGGGVPGGGGTEGDLGGGGMED